MIGFDWFGFNVKRKLKVVWWGLCVCRRCVGVGVVLVCVGVCVRGVCGRGGSVCCVIIREQIDDELENRMPTMAFFFRVPMINIPDSYMLEQ